MQQIFSQELRFKKADGTDYEDWENYQLIDLLVPDFRPVDKPSEPYLAIGIRSHCKGTFQKPNFDPKKIAMETLYKVKEGDLIVNITFAWEGAIAMVKREDNGGLVSHRFPTYTFNNKKLIGNFFQYVFFQKRFRYILDVISPGGAGRNRVLSKKNFLKIKWLTPSIKEQQKIANFLTAIDEKIHLNQQQLDKMQTYKRGLLQQMFV